MYMKEAHKIWLATSDRPIYLEPGMANRHGLIAGATGTGKTVTLKVMAESFSDMGVPVFLADIKGDVSGMCLPGCENKHIRRSIDSMGITGFDYTAYPVRFFDVYGRQGHPVRTTISEMGPELLSRLLGLNDTQSGVLRIVFRIADDQGLLLIDLKDLRSMVNYVGEHAKEYTTEYGNISAQSVGAIQRKLLTLEDQGADSFFGEPALDINDWMKRENGKGVINVLHCVKLINNPVLYSTFLLWMLSELFEQLPEAGDLEKPKMVFFFDEASLLFDDAPKALLQKIEQTVKLIRSKGVGVYFVTQNPSDIPDEVLAQLGNRVQHALRAYTPKEQKSIRAAAESFRQNPEFDTEEVITQLGTGEALVSFLDADGRPQVVQKANILPPQSLMKGADEEVKKNLIANDILGAKYSTPVDRESAYELLTKRAEKAAEEAEKQAEQEKKAKEEAKKAKEKSKTSTKKKTSYTERAANKVVDTFGREVGKSLCRGLLGLLKGK